jgi:hypothetical protein
LAILKLRLHQQTNDFLDTILVPLIPDGVRSGIVGVWAGGILATLAIGRRQRIALAVLPTRNNGDCDKLFCCSQ